MAEPKVKTKRTRLDPEVRKTMILDHAAELVASEGVSAVSMERLGRKAGISKSLVYAYFPSMKDLLQKLLIREYRHLRILQDEAAKGAETMEQMVRGITRAYLTYIEQRGLILERLGAEPSLSDHGDPTQYNRKAAVEYLAKVISRNMDLDMQIAVPMVDISFGIPTAAGQYLIHNDIGRQTVEDITVTMILGSIEAMLHKRDMSFKPLKKPS